MAKMSHQKIIDLLTPSQESVYGFLDQTTKWQTAYDISLLTGVSEPLAKAAVKELLKIGLIRSRKRIWGFDNGENEYKRVRTIGRHRKATLSDYRLFEVEPLSDKLKRIAGVKTAREIERLTDA